MSINFVGNTPEGARTARRRGPLTTAFIAVLALVTLAAAACGSSSTSSSEAAPTETAPQVTVPQSIPAGVTLRVGDQVDFLKELLALAGQDQGLEYSVEYSNFLGGPPMLQAFQAGEVDAGFVADAPLIFAQAADQDIKGVASWAPGKGTVGLITAPGVTDINGWGDLKGKTVIIQEGTVAQSTLLTGLASAGLKYSDVTIQNLTFTQIAQALPSSGADAAILSEPFITNYLVDNPTAKLAARGEDITDRVQFLIASGSALKNEGKTAALADYISRVVKAWKWVNANPEAWAQAFLVDVYKLPLEKALELVKDGGGYEVLPLPGELAEPQQTLVDLFYSNQIIPKALTADQQFDSRFNSVVEAAWNS
jgi:sulfonate transport system substrate-binding protein